jgi:hypothetical protein
MAISIPQGMGNSKAIPQGILGNMMLSPFKNEQLLVITGIH